MEYVIYFLVSECGKCTYVGFSNNLEQRLSTHKQHKVRSTENFGNFSFKILEKVPNLEYARIQEKYWKSCAGRKKLKKEFNVVKNYMPPSSSPV